jgi:PAS domain S-box-containing protein
MFRSKWKIAAVCVPLVAVCAIVAYALHLQHADRVYRIGWELDPPDQFAGPTGEPSGMAVEVVREAARRRSIRLEWVRRDESSEAALRGGKVDLWPLMTITPERRPFLHFSSAYLESVICLLTRKRSAFQKASDLANARVEHLHLPINRTLARRHLPDAELTAVSNARSLVADVCRGTTDAAFIEEDAIIHLLMDGAGCADEPLQVIPLPEARIQLGVGSSFEAAPVADAIRDEIDEMLADGRLAEMFSRWGYLSNRSVHSVEALRYARRRERWMEAAVAVFAVSLVLAIWLTLRFRTESRRAKRAESALRSSLIASREMEAKVRLLAHALRSANDCICITDVQNHFLYVNKAFGKTYGYAERELIGQHVDLIRSARAPHSMTDAIMAATAEAGWRGELWNRSKSGREFPVSLTTAQVRDDSGAVIALIGVSSDITERKQHEDALRESERRFRELLESVHLAAVMVDLEGTITFCNQSLLRSTGRQAGDILGHSLANFLAPAHRAFAADQLREVAHTGRAEPLVENAVLTSDGKERWIQWNNTVLRDPEGRPAGIASIGADVTEHRALQEQYLQAQKLESVGRLAGGIAHDFNNLLTVINGYSDILLGRLLPGDTLRLPSEQIRRAGNRAAALTQQLLAFSRKQVSQPKAIDLNALIAESEEMLGRLVGEDVDLVTVLRPRLGRVMADAGQLHQVVMNLVVNARDAMPNGGRIVIETSTAALDAASGSQQLDLPPGSYAVLAVSDDGLGMDEETKRQIFEPFYTTKPKGQGTGLGLSTVWGIVRQSQGGIAVASAPGAGTTFRIYLPVTARDSQIDECDAAARSSKGSETVLVVEDEVGVRELVSDILSMDGYRVLTARDGKSALEIACAQPIEVVLTDVVMPGINGRQLVDRLRQSQPGLKVVFMSGHAESVIATRGVLDPDVSLIQKPFAPGLLTAKIREILDRK